MIPKIAQFIICSCLLGTATQAMSCSSVAPSPEPDPSPVYSDRHGLTGQLVYDYLAASIKGSQPDFGTSHAIAPDSIAAARSYIWEIWTDAVHRNESTLLPALKSYGTTDWGDLGTDSVAVHWTVGPDTLHSLYASKGSRPAEGYPLYLFLHGSPDDALGEWQTCMAWAYYFSDAPSAYFMPKSPRGGTQCRWFQPSRQAAWESLLRQAFVNGEVNPDKIYFMGISEGAYGSQRLGSFYADYLAGVGPIAGGEQLFNCPPENLANTAFILQTGENDTWYGRSRLTVRVDTILDNLAESHPGCYVHRVDLQPGKGHGCDYTVTTPWLQEHSRVTNPRYVYWENYGMGAANGETYRYRDGFYNLRVLEPSDSRTDNMVRSVYEMKIDDNTVNLSVNVASLTETDPYEDEDWSMTLGVEKQYTPAATGKVRIYLNDSLVDLSKPVVVVVNGKERFNGMVEPDVRHLVESCAFFFDPGRLFPAAIDVTV